MNCAREFRISSSSAMGKKRLRSSSRCSAIASTSIGVRHRNHRASPNNETVSGPCGNFWMPTVLADVPLDARIFNDEPFGPVAAIRKFSQLDDAIAEANRLSYGLAGYAFTRSLRNADLLTRKVEVGMLWVNMPAMPNAEMPFGGIKDSGYGSEGGPEALDAYLNTRSVAILNS